jgi:FAD synthetase
MSKKMSAIGGSAYGGKKVIAFGTFDILHKGHIDFLHQAKNHGDYLIVVIARDKIVEKIKGKLPQNNEKKRLAGIKKTVLADKVILGHLADMYAAIKKYKPDIICLGYDQKAFVDNLEEKLFSFGLKNVRIVRASAYKPDIYKSSRLKRSY